MNDDETPLAAVAAAIQNLTNAIADQPELVDNAIVVWESVSFDEDGDPQRCIRYAVPTDNFSMSGALGLLDGGRHHLKRDIFRAGEDDE